ncbi:MAG: adenylate kinase [Oscillospiraceae bacterium]|nr:adenylate kinase [Oscillospiraceae bacterium]
MIILLAGSTHTGKTALAQKLLEKYNYPYLSIDHLKMGLIRSGNTDLTPEDDSELTVYLWPIICEIVKTAIENKQNLIVEGCYIPFGWQNDFSDEYLREIKYYCLIMTKSYIETHFSDILKYADVIEERLDDNLAMDYMVAENEKNLAICKKYGLKYILIDNEYIVNIE